MKGMLLVLLVAVSVNATAQISKEDEASALKSYKKIEAAFIRELDTMGAGKHITDYMLDTFKLNQLYSERMNFAINTIDISAVESDRAIGYQRLIDKYSKLVLANLEPRFKNDWIKAQSDWTKFHTSESNFIPALFVGQGTSAINMIGASSTELKVQRLNVIFEYYTMLLPLE